MKSVQKTYLSLLFFSWSTCYDSKGSQEQKNNCELQNNFHDVNDLRWQLRTLQRRNLANTSHSSNKDHNTGLNMTLSEDNFSQRMSALQNKQKAGKKKLLFVTEYRPSMPDLKITYSYEQMASYTKPALITKNIQKLFPYLIYKREVFERCIRQSKTLRSLNFLSWPIGVVFGLSTPCNVKHLPNYFVVFQNSWFR